LRAIGLDVGESRIGVAATDPLGMTAQPLETIKRDDGSVKRVADLVRELEADAVVVGLPLLMDGSEGEQARKVRRFAEELGDSIEVPINLVDERLTTKEAEAVLIQGRLRRGKRREATDRVAAALILRAYIDSLPEE